MQTITLPVSELKAALAGLGRVIPKRLSLAILGNVRMRQQACGLIDLTVTNLEHTLSYSMDHRGPTDPVTLLVPFADLNNVAKSCASSDSIELMHDGSKTVCIRFPLGGQTAEHPCEAAPPEEFPLQPELQGEGLVIHEALRSAILEALECASSDPSRPVLQGAFIDVGDPKAHYVVGTDGRHLFSANSSSLPLKESVFIPEHKFLGWKCFQQDGEWTLRSQPAAGDDPPWVEISSTHWRLLSRGLDVSYPQWKAVLPDPTSYQTTISVNPDSLDELMAAVQRLPLWGDPQHTIGLEALEGRLRLLGKSRPELPWTKIDIQEAGVSGPETTIFLDRRTLLKALSFGLSRIQIIDPMSPLRFSLLGRQMIVMPMRISSSSKANAPASAAAHNPPPPAEQPTPPAMQTNTPTTTQVRTTGASGSPIVTTGKEEAKSSLELALVQIEAIKAGFRESINGLSKLGDHIRQSMREQKASEKEIQGVRQTLRSLQAVRI